MSSDLHAEGVAAQQDEANQFTVAGPIVISYSRSSFAGPPQFSYKDGELELHFVGTEITRTDTALGELVSVDLENLLPVDGPLRTFTLLVPKTSVRRGDEVAFDTLGIETITSPGRFVPSGPRTLQTYRSHQLQGVASLVDF